MGWIVRVERSGRDKELVNRFDYTLGPSSFSIRQTHVICLLLNILIFCFHVKINEPLQDV